MPLYIERKNSLFNEKCCLIYAFLSQWEEKENNKKAATHIHSVAAHARKERLELPTPGFGDQCSTD